MANQGRAGWTTRDNSRDVSTFSMNVGIVTGASLPGLLTNLTNFEEALDPIILTSIYKARLSVYDNTKDPTIPASKLAQNEKKWVVHYHDSQTDFGAVPNVFYGTQYVCEIGGADESLLIANTNKLDISAGVGAAFVTAFQAAFLAPSGGTLLVDYVEYI